MFIEWFMPENSRIITSTRVQEQQTPSAFLRAYSVVWWLCFAFFTVILFTWSVILLPTLLFDRRGAYLHVATVCVWGWSVFGLNPFWSIKVEGREKLPKNSRGLFVANHESSADILAMGALFRPFKFVSKKSNFSIPVLGWAMRLNGHIELQRGARDSILRMLDDCRKHLENESPIVMFPEGTRSPDGFIQQFKTGAFQLAMETDSPVYPVVLAGTRDTLPKHGLICPLRAHVRIKVLDPVFPADFENIETLTYHVRTMMVAEKAKLNDVLDAIP